MPVTVLCNDIGEKAPEWVQVLPAGMTLKDWMVAVGFSVIQK